MTSRALLFRLAPPAPEDPRARQRRGRGSGGCLFSVKSRGSAKRQGGVSMQPTACECVKACACEKLQ
eukprot:2560839-Rhodomonas_salina.1